MSDGLRRKLTMPPWHIPYLEKHRIYDLFHELARELVIQQPVDHVLFMKQVLEHAAKNINVARVVLLSSPKINLYEVALEISYYTQQTIVNENTIVEELNREKERSQLTPQELAKCLDKIVRRRQVKGWILIDCIKNACEAKAMLQHGILPTHVIHLIPPFEPPLNNAIYSSVQEGWPEYRRSIMSVRDVFKHCLIEVHLGEKSIEEVVEECYEHIKIQKGFGGPKQPRIVILGPRGCGRKTQARLLEENLNVIHVDFEYLLCQAWISKTELGKKLRECQDDVCFQTNLLMKVLDQRILKKDCLDQGWVLTGFPFTVNDFRYLDCLDTPPNRVIFIDCDLRVCRERILNRKINVHTGSVTNLMDNRDLVIQKLLATHPKDNIDALEAELKYYCEHYGSLKKYCGQTATVINGNQPQRWVYESICAIIVRAAPACPPRNPCKLDTDDFMCLDPCMCADDLLPKSYMHLV
ncbi:hypothetical protein PPYR_03826 [Photinus pyralis]|uniref:Adenylate kinase 8 n=3 Tax=Photinus pyralis TaxID=7054 RepID=A0A5N4AWM8_PHOPY|nr:adenylate kinase 8-like [Photinus pyralis]KAB0801640.1 hypothetical protein PPYR_03826 [Photinus pyralis]